MKASFVLMNDDATLPMKGSPGACGYDLYSAEDVLVNPKSRRLISTGLKMKIDRGYARIAPRSSLAMKEIDIGAGVIDMDYRGEIKILLINNSYAELSVSKGMRIAQMIFEECHFPTVEEAETLDETERGEGGFGSTGK